MCPLTLFPHTPPPQCELCKIKALSNEPPFSDGTTRNHKIKIEEFCRRSKPAVYTGLSLNTALIKAKMNEQQHSVYLVFSCVLGL